MAISEVGGAATGVKGELIRAGDLAGTDRDAMFELLGRHFDGVGRDQFELDLGGKNWVLLLRDAGGEVVGFSTMAVYGADVGGGEIGVLCSGDTIVDPAAWGSAALPREWIAAVRQLRRALPAEQCLYWLLLTSGYRTYRLLPTFWREFWPRYDAQTPAHAQRLLDRLATDRFRACFDPYSGIVRFAHPQVLRAHLSGVPAERIKRDPHVEFFVRRNPGHGEGDELICLCELSDGNLTRAGQRVTFGTAGGGGDD